MKTALYAFLFSYAFLALLYPDIMFFADRRLVDGIHDPEVPLENTFMVASQMFNGGIQFFNRFDLLSSSFNHLAFGIYTLCNVTVAGLYFLASQALPLTGKDFYVFHSIGFYLVNTLIRTLGGYLLLSRFTQSRLVIIVCLVYLNTFLTTPLMLNGMLINNLFSFLPLLLYFIVLYFQEFKTQDLCWSILILSLALSHSVLGGLGYFYMLVHFFILACGAVAVAQAKPWRPAVRQNALRNIFSSANIQKLAATLVVAGLIMAPCAIFAKNLQQDLYIPGSGLEGTHGRLNNVFSVQGYFNAPGRYFAPLDQLSNMWNYTYNDWTSSWMFIGAGILLLSILGLVLSNNRYKYVFAATILACVLLNVPFDQKPVWLWVHWLNAVTNPFQFLVRSFHMLDLLIPYLFLPLMALGLDVLRGMVLGPDKTASWRLPAAQAVLIALCVYMASWDFYLKWYGVGLAVLILLATQLRSLPAGARKIFLPGLFCMFLLVDAAALWQYVHKKDDASHAIAPRTFSGLRTSLPVVLDYQNPQVLPWREFYRPAEKPLDPQLYSYINVFGLYNQFSPWPERFLSKPDLYKPCPTAFKDLWSDDQMRAYVGRNNRMIFLADQAMEDVPSLEAIDLLPHAQGEQWLDFDVPWRQAKVKVRVDGLREYVLKLPAAFPKYISTSVFTQDHDSLTLTVDGQDLKPAQGALAIPFTFDVRNIQTNEMHVLLPKGMALKDPVFHLRLKLPQGLREVLVNQHDRLKFVFEADIDGWLVIHYPYSPKWQLRVDGKNVKVAQVNKYFIGTPLAKGTHRVEVLYWPNPLIRITMAVSIVLSFGVFGAAVAYGFRRQKTIHRS